MKILFLVSDTNFGGGMQYFLSFVDAFPKNKYHFVIGCKPGSGLENELKQRSIACIPFHVKSKFDVIEMIRFSRSINRADYDAIFLGDGAAWNTGMFLSKLSAFNILIPIVHMTHIGLEQKIYGEAEKALSRLWDRAWAYHASHIVVSNQKNANILVDEGVSKDKIFIVRNCVDTAGIIKRISISKKDLLKTMGIDSKKTILGTISRLGPGKDAGTIINAIPHVLKKYDNCHFIIIGTGPDKQKFEDQIRTLDLESKVTFAGWVENQFDYLNLFDIFLFAGIADGVPYGLLEAMAFGKPVVATNNGAIHEAVTHEESGILVDKKNPEAMAKGIIRLLDDKELCKKLQINGEENCRKYFSIDKMHSEIREFVDKLLC